MVALQQLPVSHTSRSYKLPRGIYPHSSMCFNPRQELDLHMDIEISASLSISAVHALSVLLSLRAQGGSISCAQPANASDGRRGHVRCCNPARVPKAWVRAIRVACQYIIMMSKGSSMAEMAVFLLGPGLTCEPAVPGSAAAASGRKLCGWWGGGWGGGWHNWGGWDGGSAAAASK